MHKPLNEIVAELTAGEKVLRINDLWRKVNDQVFGFARQEVLAEIAKLGYKKRHVMLYDEAGNKNTLICYVHADFEPEDKPLIEPSLTAEQLNTIFAEDFLYEFRDAWLNNTLPADVVFDPPLFNMASVDGTLVGFFTRETLNDIINKMWVAHGRITKRGVNVLARRIQQLAQDAYIRRNTYSKAANGAPRSRVEDKLVYKYVYRDER